MTKLDAVFMLSEAGVDMQEFRLSFKNKWGATPTADEMGCILAIMQMRLYKERNELLRSISVSLSSVAEQAPLFVETQRDAVRIMNNGMRVDAHHHAPDTDE